MARANRIALVTGASAGLGEEFARQLSGRGWQLVLVARRKDRLDALAAQLGSSRAVEIDLAEAGSVERLMNDIAEAGEIVELLVNNAGFGMHGRFDKSDPERLRQMIDLNCGALSELCRAVLPAMVERKSGAILNLASTAAFQAGPGMAVYFATKAYVLSLSEALHEEVRRSGVKVSALCPGPTRTEFGEVAGLTGGGFDRLSMDSPEVVRAGLDALDKNRAIVVTGGLNKASAFAAKFLPRGLVRRIAGAIKF